MRMFISCLPEIPSKPRFLQKERSNMFDDGRDDVLARHNPECVKQIMQAYQTINDLLNKTNGNHVIETKFNYYSIIYINVLLCF